MTLQTQATAPAPRIRVPLCDLGVAPENLRASEPEDEDVPRLAETIRAAGLIYPPIVRKGRRGEARFMVLDGRRRRFALLRLAAAGAIGPDQEVECVLAGDRAAQAAAAVLPNAEHAPVHLADVIVAIGKLRRSRLATDAIARALGYDETEVRRLEAVARVHPQVLQAFRQGRLTLRQVRLFARLKDRARQAELAEAALGGWFNEADLRAHVTGGRVTVEDPRFALVSEAAYVAVGGRLDVDLFGELAAEVLDPDRLEDLWRTAAARIGQGLAAEGLELFLARERGLRAPDGLDHLPFVHWGSLDDDTQAAFGAARGEVEAALEALEAAPADADREALLDEALRARLVLARLSAGRGEVKAVLLSPVRGGLDATFYQRPAPAEAADDDEADADGDAAGTDDAAHDPWRPDIAVPEVAVEVAGVSNVQHAARAAMAGRGLTRDLADQPDAALVAVTAQLFKVLALNGHVGAEASALRISAVGVAGKAADDGLDGEVNARLEARRQAYLESGQRPIAWVTGLPQDERLALLAELAAVTLDLREARTSALRPAARIEAAEIAALCGADLARRWTPDAAFLAVHSRAQLLGFLADMGATAPSDAGLRKAELVRFVAEAAAERRWLPACLRWDAVAAEAAPDIEGDGAEADPAGQPPEPEGGTVPEEASPAATLAA